MSINFPLKKILRPSKNLFPIITSENIKAVINAASATGATRYGYVFSIDKECCVSANVYEKVASNVNLYKYDESTNETYGNVTGIVDPDSYVSSKVLQAGTYAIIAASNSIDISVKALNQAQIQIEVGAVVSQYEPYGEMIEDYKKIENAVPYKGNHHPASIITTNYSKENNDFSCIKITPDSIKNKARIDSIGGKTIVWNQLAHLPKGNGGCSISYQTDAMLEITLPESFANNAGCYFEYPRSITKEKINHKYAVLTKINIPRPATIRLGISDNGTTRAESFVIKSEEINKDILLSTIVTKQSESGSALPILFVQAQAAGYQPGEKFYVKNYMFFDLTTMFGKGNEPTREELRLMLPANYYSYANNSFLNCSVTSIDSFCKNLYGGGRIQYKFPRRMLRGEKITFTNSTDIDDVIDFYNEYGDSDKNDYWTSYKNASRTVTLAYDTKAFSVRRGNVAQLEIGSDATDYIPYREPVSIEIPQAVLDRCNLYGASAGDVYNEIDFINKKYIQRVNSVDLSEIDFKSLGEGTSFAVNMLDKAFGRNFECYNFNKTSNTTSAATIYSSYGDKCIGYNDNNSYIYITDIQYGTDVEAFKTSVEGIVLYYELKTPIEVDLSDVLPDNSIIADSNSILVFKQKNSLQLPIPSKVKYLKENIVYKPDIEEQSGKNLIFGKTYNDYAETSVYGKAYKWNQLIYDLDWFLSERMSSHSYDESTGIYSFVPTGLYAGLRWWTKKPIKKPHKYLVSYDAKTDYTGSDMKLWFAMPDASGVNDAGVNDVISTSWNTYRHIYDLSEARFGEFNRSNLNLRTNTFDNTVYLKNIMMFDLTNMFGEGNEPTVEEFNSMFLDEYYYHDEGSIKVIDDMCGKNLNDKKPVEYSYQNDYLKYNPNAAVKLKAGTYVVSADVKAPIVQFFNDNYEQLTISEAVSNYVKVAPKQFYEGWNNYALYPNSDSIKNGWFTLKKDCIITLCATVNNTYVQVEKGTVATEYEPYGGIKISSQGKNLINENKLTNEILLTDGTMQQMSSYRMSDFIKVNDSVFVSAKQLKTKEDGLDPLRIIKYDINKKIITRQLSYNSTEINNDCFYIKINWNTVSWDNVQVENGKKATEYIKYSDDKKILNLSTLCPEHPYLASVGDVKDEIICDKDGSLKLIQRTDKISLSINDMNNSDDYPGWKNFDCVSIVGKNLNQDISAMVSFGSLNIVSVNTEYSNDILYLPKSLYSLTQTEWKTNYPNLIIDFILVRETPIIHNLLGSSITFSNGVKNEVVNGQFIQRIGCVDLGTLNWVFAGYSGIYDGQISNMKKPDSLDYSGRLDGIKCSNYSVDTVAALNDSMNDKTMKRFNGSIYIKDTTYTDAAAFKAAVSGIMLYYELAEPVIHNLSNPSIVLSNGIKNEIINNHFIQRIECVDLGSLNWGYAKDNYFYTAGISSTAKQSGKSFCKNYDDIVSWGDHDKVAFINTSNSNFIIYDSLYTDAAAFKAAMSGVMLYYELATPIVHPTSTIEPLKTFYPTTYLNAEDLDLKATLKVEYDPNRLTQEEIQEAIAEYAAE